MIIPDDTSKTSIVEEREVEERSHPSVSQYTPLQSDSPPAYYGSNAHPTYIPRSIPQPYNVEDLERTVIRYRYGWSPAVRFLRALLVAWIVWTFAVFVVVSIQYRRSPEDNENPNDDHRKDGEQPIINLPYDYDIPSGYALSGCVQGSAWSDYWNEDGLPKGSRGTSLSGKAAFTLSLADARLFLISRGQLSSGTLDVITSPTQPSSSVTILVSIKYTHEEGGNLAKVCKLAHKVGQEPEGVGIFTPRWRNGAGPHQGTISFETTVIFPEVPTGEEPLYMRSFETDLPNILHRFGDLSKKVYFNAVTLKGSNQPVDVKSLSTLIADVRTKNGFIKGIFNTTSSIMLETTNGPIEVEVGLKSTGGSKPVFYAHTTNGPIEASVSLSSNSSTNNPSYTITTTTTNSDALIHIPAQPLNSKLYLTTTTTNGPAHVYLNQAFEGGFWLESPAAIVIREDEAVEDPSGAGRKRVVGYRSGKPQGKKIIAGSVLWGSAQAGRGDGLVTIRNTNAPLTLEL